MPPGVPGQFRAVTTASLLSVRMVALEASMANLSPEQLAMAREAWNGSCSELLVTLGHVPDAPAVVLAHCWASCLWPWCGG